MKIIARNTKQEIIVDKEYYKDLSSHNWTVDYYGYACRRDSVTGKTIKMHRLITQAKKGYSVDHINGNKLDNRKSNLRFCTQQQNSFNKRLSKNNTSGFKGVSRHNIGNGYWRAQIYVKNKLTHLGLFKSIKDAAIAYDKAAIENFGEYAKTNILKGVSCNA